MFAIKVPLPAETDEATIPTVAQRHADGIDAAFDQIRDIVGLILQTFLVTGPAGREQLVADTLTVQMNFVKTMTGDVSTRAFDYAIYLKLAPHHWRGVRLLRVFRQIRLNPTRLPVRGVQQSHFPVGCVAPVRSRALRVPNTDLPVVTLS